MATILKIVGENIRRMRKSKRLTLEQLAERAESNPKYLGGVERGEENIGLKKLEQVAAALKVDPYELLLPGGEGELTEDVDQNCGSAYTASAAGSGEADSRLEAGPFREEAATCYAKSPVMRAGWSNAGPEQELCNCAAPCGAIILMHVPLSQDKDSLCRLLRRHPEGVENRIG